MVFTILPHRAEKWSSSISNQPRNPSKRNALGDNYIYLYCICMYIHAYIYIYVRMYVNLHGTEALYERSPRYYTILYCTILYHTILYTICYILYIIYYILYTIYYILYTIYYILYHTIPYHTIPYHTRLDYTIL